jgi:hypothetical protein
MYLNLKIKQVSAEREIFTKCLVTKIWSRLKYQDMK